MKKKIYIIFKRGFDIIVSSLVLVILSPLYIFLSLLVLICMGWPIIFKQPRPGKDTKIFMLYKFRSMKNLYDKNGAPLEDSKRITHLGRFLRKTSLDELPQFYNIFLGDMSLIGPRPKLIKDVIFYPSYVKSFKVRPGLSSFATCNGRTFNSWEATFIYDSFYVKYMSFLTDLKLTFKTLKVVINKRGANDGTGNLKDYIYPNYLLRIGKITKDKYDMGIKKAKDLEDKFKSLKGRDKKIGVYVLPRDAFK